MMFQNKKINILFVIMLIITGVFFVSGRVINAEDQTNKETEISEENTQRLKNAIVMHTRSSFAYVNNKKISIDTANSGVHPIIKNGKTLVPLKFISTSLGAKVEWNEKTSIVTVALNGKIVKLSLGSKKIMVNNKEFLIDVPAQVINGRTFVPLKALTQAFEKKVFYHKGLIIISDKENIVDGNADEMVSKMTLELYDEVIDPAIIKADIINIYKNGKKTAVLNNSTQFKEIFSEVEKYSFSVDTTYKVMIVEENLQNFLKNGTAVELIYNSTKDVRVEYYYKSFSKDKVSIKNIIVPLSKGSFPESIVFFKFANGEFGYAGNSKYNNEKLLKLIDGVKEKASERIEFETVAIGSNCSHYERKNHIITDENKWKSLLSEAYKTYSSIPTLTQVDFNKEMVIAVFQGRNSSGGFGIKVTKIVEKDQSIEVFIEETKPKSGQIVTMVLTQPYHIIKLKKSNNQVIFK